MTRIGSTRLPSGLGAAAFALGAALAFATPAAADDERVSDAQYEAVLAALEARGYRDVGDVELEHGRIEADAVHPDGHEVDLELDPESLEILSEERD
jgi:hypothetical protein